MLVTCIFENWAAGDFLFAKVIGKLTDNKVFEAVEFPEVEFPSTGDISIPKTIVPAHMKRYRVGIWDVSKQGEAIPGSRYCEYKAKRFHKNLTEIIAINYFSTQVDLARKELLQGISLPYPVHGEVFIEFQDGVVVGPIDIKTRDNGYEFYCDPVVFHMPLNAWSKKENIDLLVYQRANLKTRIFSASVTHPQKEFLIDMASVKVAITSVLRFACKKGPGSNWVSKRDQNEIVDRITSIGDWPEHVEVRISKALDYLRMSVETGELTDELFDTILEFPTIREEIDLLKSKIVQEEKEKLHAAEQELVKRIEGLLNDKNRLEIEICNLKEEGERTQRSVLKTGENAINQITERIRLAIDNSHEIFSQVALLKPFLGRENAQSHLEFNQLNIEKQRALINASDTVASIIENLTAVGILKKDAAVLGKEIYAAISCGQAVFFRGSLANLLLKTIALTINSEKSYIAEVPAGVYGYGEITKLIKETTIKETIVLGLKGINNSCLNTYASPLIDFVVERSLLSLSPNLVILGSISDGASAINDSMLISSLGPIIDTDSISWRKKGTRQVVPCIVNCLEEVDCEVTEFVPEEINRIIDLCERKEPSSLWTINIKAVYDRLTALQNNQESGMTPLHSLLFGWILPRALECGADISEYSEFIKTGGSNGVIDQRIVRLLNKTMGELDNE